MYDMIYFPTFGWFYFMVNVGYVNIPYTWILWEGRHLNQPLIFTGRRQVTPMLCEDSARHPLPDTYVRGIEVEETELIFVHQGKSR